MQQETDVGAVPPSLKPVVLPNIAMRLVLGGKAVRLRPGQIEVAFEDDKVQMNETDFDICARAAKRARNQVAGPSSMTQIFELWEKLQKYVTEEIFLPNATRVLYFASLSVASAYWRCVLPMEALNRGTRVSAHIASGITMREALEYDVVVIQIDHTDKMLQFAKRFRELGRKVVYEIDDVFDGLEKWHPQYGYYSRPEIRKRVLDMMAAADAVQVTTPFLKDRYADFCHKIEVVPNLIPVEVWPKAKPHCENEFRIVWAGSKSHSGDLDVVARPLADFVRKHADARVFFFGDKPSNLDLPSDQVQTIAFCAFEDYAARLADISADVALAPLASCDFNLGKSNVKLLEYMACGYPVLASDVGPYHDTISNGCNGILAGSEQDWARALDVVYQDRGYRKLLADGGAALVRKFDLDLNRHRIEAFFTNL